MTRSHPFIFTKNPTERCPCSGRFNEQVTVNVATFLSEDGHIRQEIAASLKKLTQSYDVFFLALCTSVEIRVSCHCSSPLRLVVKTQEKKTFLRSAQEKIRQVFQLNDLLPPWLDWQHRVRFPSLRVCLSPSSSFIDFFLFSVNSCR